MKSLDEFIRKSYYDNLYIESMQDYFGEFLPNACFESINNDEYKDFILENLNTHDVNNFKDKLYKLFSNKFDLNIIDINNKKQAFQLTAYPIISNNKEFKNLLNYFGYYISKKYNEFEDGDLVEILHICPVYSKKVNDLVYNENYGKLYHFTAGKNVNEILNTGLRCKTAKYRYYPKRVYLYSSDKKLKDIKNIKEFILSVVDIKNIKKYGLSIFKIDLSKLGNDLRINFYDDDCMNDKNAVFTYNNIPKECIKKLDIKLEDL